MVTPVRCQCTGQCGRITGRKRGCAEPGLDGRCRAEHGAAHPRSDRVAEVLAVQVGPRRWVELCQDCRAVLTAGPARRPPHDDPPLFPEGER